VAKAVDSTKVTQLSLSVRVLVRMLYKSKVENLLYVLTKEWIIRLRTSDFHYVKIMFSGPGSSVSIATGCTDWTVQESNPGGGEPVQTGPRAQPASCTMDTRSFPGVESGRGVMLTPHPLLVPRSKNRVELYLFSP
jgi:hypothetical protein